MTAIHVVSSANRHLYESTLDSYFRIRHDVFAIERGWRAVERCDGLDIDAFDRNDTIHLIAMDGDRVVGGQRLVPTTAPHMLSEIFADLATTKGIPVGPTVWEASRYFVVRERRSGRTDCTMLAGVQEFGLEEGITHYSAVIETWWLPRLHEAGFVVRPLGLPALIENQWAIAAEVEVRKSSRDRARALGGIGGPVLVRRGLLAPAKGEVVHVT
jgi:acyl-homoserine lactone synthase